MQKFIWKYELQTTDESVIELPKNAEILTLQAQRDVPCIWALVDPNKEKEKRYFETYGTGHPFAVNASMFSIRKYIGSYQLLGAELIFHVFERLT